MHVGVRQSQHQLAGLTLAARWSLRSSRPSSGAFTHERLREPQSQPLFPDPTRPFEQERLRQPAGGDGAYQPVSRPLMAVQGGEWHGRNLVWGSKTGRFAKCNALRTMLLGRFLGACAGLAVYPI